MITLHLKYLKIKNLFEYNKHCIYRFDHYTPKGDLYDVPTGISVFEIIWFSIYIYKYMLASHINLYFYFSVHSLCGKDEDEESGDNNHYGEVDFVRKVPPSTPEIVSILAGIMNDGPSSLTIKNKMKFLIRQTNSYPQ